MTTITVEQYVERRHNELEQFKAHWLRNQKFNPNDWPEQLGEGEWFEQEAAHGSYGERHE